MGVPIPAYINVFVLLTTTAVGLARFSRLSIALKALTVFCIMLCAESAAEFYLAFHATNNSFVSNAGLGIEALFLAAVYAIALDVKSVRRMIVVLSIVFVCIWVPDKIFFEDPKAINEAMCIISGIFTIVISVIALHTVAKRTTSSLTDEPLFWIATANILASTGDMFVLGVSNELLAMGVSYFTAAWYINWSLDIISYIFYIKAFLCKATPEK